VAKGIILRFGGISPHDSNELAVWDGIHRRCGLEFANLAYTHDSPSDCCVCKFFHARKGRKKLD
jgi:hypothetical protein